MEEKEINKINTFGRWIIRILLVIGIIFSGLLNSGLTIGICILGILFTFDD